MKTVFLIVMALLGGSLAFAQNNHAYDTKEFKASIDSMRSAGWTLAEPISEIWLNFDADDFGDPEMQINIEADPLGIGDTIFVGFFDSDDEFFYPIDKSINPLNELVLLPIDEEVIELLKLRGIEYIRINEIHEFWFTRKDNKSISRRVKQLF